MLAPDPSDIGSNPYSVFDRAANTVDSSRLLLGTALGRMSDKFLYLGVL